MKRKQTTGEYLAFLATKCDVYYSDFFNALVLAWENQKSSCGPLSIDCRGKTEKDAMFLVKKGEDVVAQFPVPTEFLTTEGNSTLTFADTKVTQTRKQIVAQAGSAEPRSIKDLRSGMNHVSLKAKVLEVSAARRVTTRYGNFASLAKALIEDDTGKIKLCLWNEQVNSVAVGDVIAIQEARVSKFGSEVQLSLGAKGTLTTEDVEAELLTTDVPIQE